LVGGKLKADEMFEKLNQEMIDKFLSINPDYATSLGLHEPYDYELPNGSTVRFLENLRLEEEWIKKLKQTIKQEELSEEHKLEWNVITLSHENSKFGFYERRTHELNPDTLDLIGGLVFVMFTRDYAPLEKRVEAIAARIEKTPEYLGESRSRFEKSQPVKLWTEMAIETAQNMAGLFQFISSVTKGKVSEKTYERLEKAVENLQPALKTHLEWLQKLLPKTTTKWALGREKFEKLLKLRGLGMTSDEILQLGMEYLEKLKNERKRLAEQVAPGKPAEETLKAIESNAPKTFEEALEFTKKTPAFIAPVIPFAALIMPAKYDKPQIGVYIVTRPKDIANMGKHLNYASIRNTAVHEAFPGHFLQGTISNRGSIIRLLAEGTETTEGWAHYCEQLMAEKGFTKDLNTRLIQVNDMIWRAVRIIVDVKLSRGEMSFEEAVNMLVRETQMSQEAAEAEVKRYTQTPGYPLSYLLGKHLILKLKAELEQKMDNKFDEKFFHDTITANGYLPIAMLRKVFDSKIEQPNVQ